MDERELTALGQLLAERICGTNEAFCFQILRLLGQGQPVSVAQMGEALGMSEVAHQFRINGHTLYTWCALDALTYPILLEQTAQVESICPITRTPIRLRVGPEGMSALDPATAMVSLTIPDTQPDACNRASFCDQGHFFASPQAAHPPARRVRRATAAVCAAGCTTNGTRQHSRKRHAFCACSGLDRYAAH